MTLVGRPARWLAGMLASMGVALCAGEFAPPTVGPVAFRRDQIPLDEEAMAGLSKQLEELAKSLKPSTARDRRGAAQMLALALALDPANSTARDLVVQYQKNRRQPAAQAEPLDKQRARILPVITWLDQPEAGKHGHSLAACLKDILVIADPEHPDADELGAWTGWIPSISAYESPTASQKNQTATQTPERDLAAKKDIPLSAAEVHTLLWQQTGNFESARWHLATAPLQMSTIRMNDKSGQPQPFTIAIGSSENAEMFEPTNGMLQKLLATQLGALPPGYRVSINSPQLNQSIVSKKRQTISAAAAVLASAAVTGREPEAIILGQIDASGAFQLPTEFWDQLKSLGKGTGQRLVLPAAAATYLPALLTLEKPGFFLEYEVLLATDFKQLLDFASKEPDEALAKTTAKFREIRDHAGTQDVRQYIANRFVHQRLMDIAQDAPYHASARMLLVQAAGKRPPLLTRPVLAAELRFAIEPMDWIIPTAAPTQPENDSVLRINYGPEFSASDKAKLATTIELCRTRVEELDAHADKNERELIEQTRKVVYALRTLERTIRRRDESYVVQKATRAVTVDLTNLYQGLIERLNRETAQ